MKNGLRIPVSHFLAEDEGFEPPIPFSILRFECSAFNRSANPPLKFAYQRNPVTQGKHHLLDTGIFGYKGIKFYQFSGL